MLELKIYMYIKAFWYTKFILQIPRYMIINNISRYHVELPKNGNPLIQFIEFYSKHLNVSKKRAQVPYVKKNTTTTKLNA